MNNRIGELQFFERSNLGLRTRVRKIASEPIKLFGEDKFSAQMDKLRFRIFPRAAGPRLREPSTEKILSAIMLLFAIGFNLWLYRLEPTAKIDPNDNNFQYALVHRTNQIWDFAHKTCSYNPICFFSYLIDHWVPNWNEGYNLPYYYAHLPQVAIVASYRFISLFISHYSLFSYYHLIIYLLLCLFPLSMFLALRVAGFSWITSGFAAILASHLSTDGLYGLDPPSFLWRGYGLSSQLFAMVFLPLALAYAYKYLSRSNQGTKLLVRGVLPAVLFLAATTSGHIGIGIMAFLSLIPLAFGESIMQWVSGAIRSKEFGRIAYRQAIGIAILAVPAMLLLSYWLVPAFLGDKFHNFSFWDPVWKFNSYGAPETIIRLFNGDLFDYGRLPIFTLLVILGMFVLLFSIRNSGFALLFLFWFFLYFGRTTWGGLLDSIPGLKEFHQSRFIVGVHMAGLFLAPIGLEWIVKVFKPHSFIRVFAYSIIGILVVLSIYPQTIRYSALNDTLILRANGNFAKQSTDANALVSVLQELQQTAPGRVFAGRAGWGKDFKLAETSILMYLGNFGLPTVLWMPETWSPNADTEQYFREEFSQDYELYNFRYVATQANLPKELIRSFWVPIKENPSWRLYGVLTQGYFSAGVRPAIVAADKYSRGNVVRLWIQSDDPKNGLYPQLTFDTKNYPVNKGLPNFKMLDEVTFRVPDGSTHNLFAERPRYTSPLSSASSPSSLIFVTSQSSDTDMIFRATVEVEKDCTECLVVLKQSYHPSWRVTVDGKRVDPIIVFPFFIGIPVTEGTHTIIASYQPSGLKVFLLIFSFISLISLIVLRSRVPFVDNAPK